MEKHPNLAYLYNKLKTIYWSITTPAPGKKLSFYETYDLIYDDKDLRIRKLNGLRI